MDNKKTIRRLSICVLIVSDMCCSHLKLKFLQSNGKLIGKLGTILKLLIVKMISQTDDAISW